MSTKYLLALVFLIIAAQAQQVSVGNSEEFRLPAFKSIFRVPNLASSESVTVFLQWAVGALGEGQTLELLLDPVSPGEGYVSPSALTCEGGASVSTCSVTFPGATWVQTSGNYELTIQYQTDPLIEDRIILVSSMIVSGNSISRTNPVILKQTVAIGNYRFHRIFFRVPTTITISLPYTQEEEADELDDSEFITVISESTATNALPYQVSDESIDLNGEGPQVLTNLKVVRWSFNVGAGYSWIVVDYTVHPQQADLTVVTYPFRMNWATIAYPCPFNEDYPDVTGIFRGCTFAPDLSRLPCVLYNETINVCQECLAGYSLVNGRCLQNDCPAGQYRRYGQCLPNPVGCDTYNDFTKCTKCSIGYTLNNGVCDKTPLTCTGRTYFNSATWTCDKVDDKCREWSATTGLCTSCISSGEKAVNGKCIPLEQACPDRQFVNAALDCVDIDPLCETFEKIGGRCIKCVWGHEFNATQGKCVKIVCPSRFVPNDFGRCVRVSDLCEQFDVRGNCLACIPTHILSENGVCLQLETPRQCPERQYLGNDNFCHEVSEFCEIYSRETGLCTKCVNNYFLMYTGQCVLQRQCRSRQVLINNDCHDVSPTCGNFDRTTGKCLNCVSEEYELYFGLCIPVKTCGVRQWSDDNGVCRDVNQRCNTFNPSTGDCTSCVQGFNFLNGICCVRGQFNQNGQCVDAQDASQLSNSNGCRTFVNGIGCVRCDDRFRRAQDQFGFYFCQAV